MGAAPSAPPGLATSRASGRSSGAESTIDERLGDVPSCFSAPASLEPLPDDTSNSRAAKSSLFARRSRNASEEGLRTSRKMSLKLAKAARRAARTVGWSIPDWSADEGAPADEVMPAAVAADAAEAQRELNTNRRARLMRYALPILLVLLLLGVILFSSTHTGMVLRWVMSALRVLRQLGAASVAVVIGTQIVLVVLAMPSWFVWLGAGAAFTLLWGQTLGIVIAFGAVGAGVWVGSVLAFLIGRYALRPYISEWTSERLLFRAIDLAVLQRGLEIGFLLKLSPVIPLNVVNYVLSVTQMQFWHFVVTCPGSYLAVAVYVLAGASVSSLAAIGNDPKDAISASTRRLLVRCERRRLTPRCVTLAHIIRPPLPSFPSWCRQS